MSVATVVKREKASKDMLNLATQPERDAGCSSKKLSEFNFLVTHATRTAELVLLKRDCGASEVVAATALEQKIKSNIDDISQRLAKLDGSSSGLLDVLKERYAKIPLSPLGWRDERGLPYLMPMKPNIEPPRYVVRLQFNDERLSVVSVSLPFNIPTVLNQYYVDLPLALTRKFENYYGSIDSYYYHNSSLSLTPSVSGIIERKHRLKIEEALALFGDSRVFLIVDTTGIELKKEPQPVPLNPCPVVVILEKGHLFHYYDFDATPVEIEAMMAAKR